MEREQSYAELAFELAVDAIENHLESRRGIWHLEKEDLLCIYDNNPYKDDEQARPRQNKRNLAKDCSRGNSGFVAGQRPA